MRGIGSVWGDVRHSFVSVATVGILALAAVGCGGDSTATGPCSGVTCSSHGVCAVQADGLTAYCQCAVGYHPVGVGLDCAANDVTDPCTGVSCSSHGTCRVDAGNPTCDCSSGFEPDPSGLLCLPATVPDADAEAEADAEPDVAEDVGADADGDEDVGADADVPDEAEAESSADADVEDDADAEADADAGCTAHTDCDDGLSCTLDTCNFATHACAHAARDAECDDGLVCNGSEVCDSTTGAAGTGCAAGTPMDCSDGDDCTEDVCDDGTRSCLHPARDGDGDTVGDAACGGTDCDDTDANVFPGQLETCNRADDDCDTLVDEDLWEAGADGLRLSGVAPGNATNPVPYYNSATGNALVAWMNTSPHPGGGTQCHLAARVVRPSLVLPGAEMPVAAMWVDWATPPGCVWVGTAAPGSGAEASRYAFAWMEGAVLRLGTITEGGTTGTTATVATTARHKPGVWFDSVSDEIGVVWFDTGTTPPKIKARRYAAATLAPLSPAVELTDYAEVGYPWNVLPMGVPSYDSVLARVLIPFMEWDVLAPACPDCTVPRVVAARSNLVRIFDSVVVPSGRYWMATRSVADEWQIVTGSAGGGVANLYSNWVRSDGTFRGAPTTWVTPCGGGLVTGGPEGEFGHVCSGTLQRRDWGGTNIGSGIAAAVFGGVSSTTRAGAGAVAYGSDLYWVSWEDSHDLPNINVYVNTVRCAY